MHVDPFVCFVPLSVHFNTFRDCCNVPSFTLTIIRRTLFLLKNITCKRMCTVRKGKRVNVSYYEYTTSYTRNMLRVLRVYEHVKFQKGAVLLFKSRLQVTFLTYLISVHSSDFIRYRMKVYMTTPPNVGFSVIECQQYESKFLPICGLLFRKRHHLHPLFFSQF